jgi:hypothetical protein
MTHELRGTKRVNAKRAGHVTVSVENRDVVLYR